MAQSNSGNPSLDAAKIAMWQKFGSGGGSLPDANTNPAMTPPTAPVNQTQGAFAFPGRQASGPAAPMGGQQQPMTYPTNGYHGMTNQQPTSGPVTTPGFPAYSVQAAPHQDLTALLQQWLQQRMQGAPSNSPYTSFLNNSPYTKY